MPRVEKSEYEKAVSAVIRRFSLAFSKFDATELLTTLDTEISEILYQAEERWEPLTSREEIEAYIKHLGSKIQRFEDIVLVDFKIREISDAVASVYMRSWCRINFTASHPPLDGQVRQTFVLRKVAEEWRITDYHESRQFPGLEEAMGSQSVLPK